MSKVIDLDSKRLGHWFNVFAMCLPCSYRWIATVNEKVSLFKLECPMCQAHESFGSVIPTEYERAVCETYAADGEPEK